MLIGLDPELSLTGIIFPLAEILKIQKSLPYQGLYHFFAEGADISEIIEKTTLPTLDIIPETHDIALLNKWIGQQRKREFLFRDKLLPLLGGYDLIVFDHTPTWNYLKENALITTDVVICPLACNQLSYDSVKINHGNLPAFQQELQLSDQETLVFLTLLERNAISEDIKNSYRNLFKDQLIEGEEEGGRGNIVLAVRRFAAAQEALKNKQTIFEYAPLSPLANDYYEIFQEIWKKLLKHKRHQISTSTQGAITVEV